MEAAARKIVEMGARAVIVKGGHMERAVDVLFDGNEMVQLGGDKVKTENTHGTGCTFASAIAAQLASGRAIERSRHARQSLRHQSHRKRLRRSAKAACRSIISIALKIEPPARGIHEVPATRHASRRRTRRALNAAREQMYCSSERNLRDCCCL